VANRLAKMKTQLKTMNTMKTLRSLLGVGLLCGAGFSLQAANPVSFSIDMSSQPTAAQVYLRGSFNNWGNPDVTVNGLLLTNDPSGPTPAIYSGAIDIADAVGTLEQCKFFYNPGDNWESIPNRQFVIDGGAQTLPLTSWNVSDWPAPVNNVTFQVDMNAQVLTRAFTNVGDFSAIKVSGVFNGWGDGTQMTNNTAAIGSLSNIFSVVIPISGYPGATIDGYKFRMNGGWESDPNRTFTITGGDQVLPLVYYNRASICDLEQLDTLVTFTLQIAPGTPYGLLGDPNSTPPTSGTFNPPTDKIYINGDFQNWKPSGPDYGDWADPNGLDANPFTATPAGLALELTNVPATDKYKVTLTIPAGKTLKTTYKYTINGYDDESGMAMNHVRYIRALSGVPFTMPLDQFGTNPVPPVVETATSNLVIGAVSGGKIPLTWGGLQCLTLQTKSSLTGGLWTDVPATEGTSSTNWPVGAGPQFFRWQKTP
jgi:hypothetical protein